MDLDFSPPAWTFVARRTFFLFFSLPSKGSSFSKIFTCSKQRTAGDKCQSCIAVECHLPLKRLKVTVQACSSSAAWSLRLPRKLWLDTLSSSGWLGSLGEWQPQTHLPGCPRCPCWCFLSPGTTFYTGARCCGVASLNKRGGKSHHFKAWSTAFSLRLLHPEQEGKLSQVVLLQPQKSNNTEAFYLHLLFILFHFPSI